MFVWFDPPSPKASAGRRAFTAELGEVSPRTGLEQSREVLSAAFTTEHAKYHHEREKIYSFRSS